MTRRLAILSFAVLLAGCVPGGIVPRQTEISGTSVGLGNAPAPAIDKGWWTAFADPGLDSLMTEALKGNPGLGEAMARLRAAKAGVEAANATLYPRLDFNGQEQRDRFSDIYIYPPPYAGSYRWIGTIEGDLSWNIDFWGKQAAQLDKAKALQTASRMDVEAARLALSSAVFQAYVDLDRAYKLAPNFKLLYNFILLSFPKILKRNPQVILDFEYLRKKSLEKRKHHSRHYKREVKRPASPYIYNNCVWSPL